MRTTEPIFIGHFHAWLESEIGRTFTEPFVHQEVRYGRLKKTRIGNFFYVLPEAIREWFDLWKREENDLPYDIVGEAYKEVRLAKRQGKITPEPCEVCGDLLRPEGHHEDYEMPLSFAGCVKNTISNSTDYSGSAKSCRSTNTSRKPGRRNSNLRRSYDR
jgi:hypothetical protein